MVQFKIIYLQFYKYNNKCELETKMRLTNIMLFREEYYAFWIMIWNLPRRKKKKQTHEDVRTSYSYTIIDM